WCSHGYSEAAAQLRERETSHSPFGDQRDDAVDQRRLQITVVVGGSPVRHVVATLQCAERWSRHECCGSYPIASRAGSLASSESNSPSSRVSGTSRKTSARSVDDDLFITVSAAAMTKLGLPATASAGASSARRQAPATSRASTYP